MSLLSASEQDAFGAYLRAVRERQSLSVRTVAVELAKRAARRPTRRATALRRANAHQVRAWEAGDVSPSAETVRTLAPLYELSELELLLKGGYLEEVVPFIVGLF